MSLVEPETAARRPLSTEVCPLKPSALRLRYNMTTLLMHLCTACDLMAREFLCNIVGFKEYEFISSHSR